MESLSIAEKSLAVLPFVNMSPEKEMDYFSDGITEEIINALASIEQIKVTSRTSSFFFKGKDLPLKKIAKELNVASILEGSIRVSGNTIRITAQLIQAENDFHFWSETWDRKLDNIFQIQDEISLQIAEKLREEYGHFEIQDHLVGKTTGSFEAYDLSLKAKYHFNKWNPANAKIAVELYTKSAELDPGQADTFAGLADAYSFLAVTEMMPYEEAWKKVKDSNDRALAIDPENAGAHYQLSNISFFQDANFGEAVKHNMKAIELRPNYTEAHQFMAFLYIISDEMEKALPHLEKALEIDPISPETLFYKGYYQYRKKNYTRALDIFTECLSKNPDSTPTIMVRNYCLLKLGKYEAVISGTENINEDMINQGERLGLLTLTYILKKADEKTIQLMEKLKLEAENPRSFQAHSYLFLALVNLGENDRAFSWLSKAINLKSPILMLSFCDPLAENLRDDDRFNDFAYRLYGMDTSQGAPVSEKKSLLDTRTTEEYHGRLMKFMEVEKPFLIPNLSIRSLASQLELHPNKLSWLLNEKIGKNFNEFINHFRIEYFKQLALDPKNSHISLIGLAYESGFNSKTVFNSYFRKETGMTPKEFIARAKPD